MNKLILSITFALLLLLFPIGTAGENATFFRESKGMIPAVATASDLVSARKPDGLILSEGNLYFTSHDGNLATVWRTAQGSSPGKELALYCETNARFGDIVFARVDGVFFGYFFARPETPQTNIPIRIKHVPLTGGTATVIATIPDVDIDHSHRNLVTDGINLYWQDVETVRKVPVRGGPITVLDPSHPNTPTAGIALLDRKIFYASLQDIRFVPTTGAVTVPEIRTIHTVPDPDVVTTLHAVSNGVYWGERNGAIRFKVGSTIKTLPSSSGLPSSISTNGTTAGGIQAWSTCANRGCRLHIDMPGRRFSIPIAQDAFGVTVTPSGTVFWGDAAGVHRRAL